MASYVITPDSMRYNATRGRAEFEVTFTLGDETVTQAVQVPGKSPKRIATHLQSMLADLGRRLEQWSAALDDSGAGVPDALRELEGQQVEAPTRPKFPPVGGSAGGALVEDLVEDLVEPEPVPEAAAPVARTPPIFGMTSHALRPERNPFAAPAAPDPDAPPKVPAPRPRAGGGLLGGGIVARARARAAEKARKKKGRR